MNLKPIFIQWFLQPPGNGWLTGADFCLCLLFSQSKITSDITWFYYLCWQIFTAWHPANCWIIPMVVLISQWICMVWKMMLLFCFSRITLCHPKNKPNINPFWGFPGSFKHSLTNCLLSFTNWFKSYQKLKKVEQIYVSGCQWVQTLLTYYFLIINPIVWIFHAIYRSLGQGTRKTINGLHCAL